MSAQNTSTGKTVASNKKARFNYAILEEFDAGIMLLGTEVKSLRQGKVNLVDAHAAVKDDAIWLYNLYIAEYSGGNRFNHETHRPRKLLLHKQQITKLTGKLKVRGVTLVPLSLYFNSRGLAKVKLALAVGKKEYEKRDTLKKRDWQRDKARIMREKNG